MVIVTGGTSGIGEALVRRLDEASVPVVFLGRDEERGRGIEASLSNARFVRCDVSKEEDCLSSASQVLSAGDAIAGLVNNAGIGLRAPADKTTTEAWDRVFATNTRSAFILTREFLPALRNAKGSVVNVSSVAGYVGEAGLSAYAASKAALIAYTQTLALEEGPLVRFNAVCPGQVATRMMSRVMQDSELLTRTISRIPAGRLAKAAEIAEAIFWLLSPSSSFVNGAVLPVDGGETSGLR